MFKPKMNYQKGVKMNNLNRFSFLKLNPEFKIQLNKGYKVLTKHPAWFEISSIT